MKKRIAVIAAAVLLVLVGATLAFGGPGARLINDQEVRVDAANGKVVAISPRDKF
jgi:hypothetical protein